MKGYIKYEKDKITVSAYRNGGIEAYRVIDKFLLEDSHLRMRAASKELDNLCLRKI